MYFLLDLDPLNPPLIDDLFVSLPIGTNRDTYTVTKCKEDVKKGYDLCIRLPKSPSQTDIISTFINEFAIYLKLIRTSEYRAVFDFVCSTFFRQRFQLLQDNIAKKSDNLGANAIGQNKIRPLEKKKSIYFIEDYTDMGLYNFGLYRRKKCLNPTLGEYYLRMKTFDKVQKPEFKSKLLLSSPAVLFLNINRIALKICRRSPNIVSIFASINEVKDRGINDRVTSAVDMPWLTDNLFLREAGNLHPSCGGNQQVQIIGFKENRTSRFDEAGIKANLNYKNSKKHNHTKGTPYEPVYFDWNALSPYAYPVRVSENHDQSYDLMCDALGLDLQGDSYLTNEELQGKAQSQLRHIHMNSMSFLDPDALSLLASLNTYKVYGSNPDQLRYGGHQLIRKIVDLVVLLLDYDRTFSEANYSEYGQLKSIYLRSNLTNDELALLSRVFTETVEFYKIANYDLKDYQVRDLFLSVQSCIPLTNYSKPSMYKNVPIKMSDTLQRRLIHANSMLTAMGESEIMTLGGSKDNDGFYAKATFIERMFRTADQHEYLSLSNRILDVVPNSYKTRFCQQINRIFRIKDRFLGDEDKQNEEYKKYASDLGLALTFNMRLRYPVGTICDKWSFDTSSRLGNTDFLMQDIGIGIYHQTKILNDCDTLRLTNGASIEAFWLRMTDYSLGGDTSDLLVRQFRTIIPLLSNNFEMIRNLGVTQNFRDTMDALPNYLRSKFLSTSVTGNVDLTNRGRQLFQFVNAIIQLLNRIEE